jgi:tetratricopeptide (TPR) repeat protein
MVLRGLVTTAAAVASALAVALASASAGTTAPEAAPPYGYPRISAVFLPDKFATSYSIKVDKPLANITWTLTLQLVDKEGTPNPSVKDSGAKVDPLCNNSLLPGGRKLIALADYFATYRWRNQRSTFLWYHGDIGTYRPNAYGCQHQRMGPHGHQGVVRVTVNDGLWECEASFEGTNDTTTPVLGPRPRCRIVPDTKPRLARFGKALGRIDYKLDAWIRESKERKPSAKEVADAAGSIHTEFDQALRHEPILAAFVPLIEADGALNDALAQLNKGNSAQAKTHLGVAARRFWATAAELEAAPSIDDSFVDAFASLAQRARDAAGDEAHVRKEIETLAKTKFELVSALPPVFKANAGRAFNLAERFAEALDAAYKATKLDDVVDHLRRARTWKQQFERAILGAP